LTAARKTADRNIWKVTAVTRCVAWRRLGLSLILCFGVGLAAPSHALQDADWLYGVEQPVSAQTDAERTRAASEGLLVVLTRLTGLVSVPRNEQITAALQRPSAYYNRFVFITKPLPAGGEQRYLRVTFQSAAIQGLLREAGLPVWWSKRPTVMAWVVMDTSGERQILSSASRHPLVTALRERAQLRGLPFTLPLMDLDDNLAVSAADVWGKVGQSLDAASARYDADIVLVGRITRNPGFLLTTQPYRGDWEVWVDGRPVAENFSAANAEEAAGLGMDMIANRLAEQFAVLPRQLQVQRLAVAGLEDTGSYAAFMRYLESLEFIDRVAVTALAPEALQIAVASRAEAEQLEMLLTAEGRLRRDLLHRGLYTQLIWQD